jgi:hypothetical protein
MALADPWKNLREAEYDRYVADASKNREAEMSRMKTMLDANKEIAQMRFGVGDFAGRTFEDRALEEKKRQFDIASPQNERIAQMQFGGLEDFRKAQTSAQNLDTSIAGEKWNLFGKPTAEMQLDASKKLLPGSISNKLSEQNLMQEAFSNPKARPGVLLSLFPGAALSRQDNPFAPVSKKETIAQPNAGRYADLRSTYGIGSDVKDTDLDRILKQPANSIY